LPAAKILSFNRWKRPLYAFPVEAKKGLKKYENQKFRALAAKETLDDEDARVLRHRVRTDVHLVFEFPATA
jgi:hypothetical protein